MMMMMMMIPHASFTLYRYYTIVREMIHILGT